MTDIDDSALFHGGAYDAQKAHEYYLRTRKLKGRTPGAVKTSAGRPAGGRQTPVKGHLSAAAKAANRKQRQAELEAQRDALEKRLDRLKEVLQEMVEAAKKRSGAAPTKKSSDKAPETSKDKADRNSAEKKDKPTSAEQRERNKKARDRYKKDHPAGGGSSESGSSDGPTVTEELASLNRKIADIKVKIQKAMKEARKTAGQHDSKSGSQTHKTDGPQGR